jgi:hypothetical protein
MVVEDMGSRVILEGDGARVYERIAEDHLLDGRDDNSEHVVEGLEEPRTVEA